jgi:hypothetical protein
VPHDSIPKASEAAASTPKKRGKGSAKPVAQETPTQSEPTVAEEQEAKGKKTGATKKKAAPVKRNSSIANTDDGASGAEEDGGTGTKVFGCGSLRSEERRNSRALLSDIVCFHLKYPRDDIARLPAPAQPAFLALSWVSGFIFRQ